MTARSPEHIKFPQNLVWHPDSDDCGHTAREVSLQNTLSAEVCVSSRCAVVTCRGPLIQGTVSELSDELQKLIKEDRSEYCQVVIDLKGVQSIHVDGYYELIHWKDIFVKKGGDLRLANVANPNAFEQQMRSLGKPNLFRIFPTSVEAVASY